jgi:hypothetical protein
MTLPLPRLSGLYPLVVARLRLVQSVPMTQRANERFRSIFQLSAALIGGTRELNSAARQCEIA